MTEITAWIPTTDRLPTHGQYVLGLTTDRHVFGWDRAPRTMEVVQFVQGRVPNDGVRHWPDQGGNNLVPYRWQGAGPCSWFGQDVTHWAPLPEPPEGLG